MSVCVSAFLTGKDIPPEAGRLLQTLVTVCVGAYAASSVAENYCIGKEKEDDEDN